MAQISRRQHDLLAFHAASDVTVEEQEIGFLASLFTRTSLPYKDPGDDVPAYHRRNGAWHMTIQPGMRQRDGRSMSVGYPYGVMPRLLLTWMCSEIVRQDSKKLFLGPSLAEFMRSLGLKPTGGRNGSITKLRDQALRLFEANFSFRWDGPTDKGNSSLAQDVGGKLNIATAWQLYWPRNASEFETPSLLDEHSHVVVSEVLYQQVISHPVPIDLNALSRLRGSAMRLDIYSWLTWRMYSLSRPTTITWQALREQFGANHADTPQGHYQFRKDFTAKLTEVQLVYREANVEVTDNGLVLRPSMTHVPLRGTAHLRSAGSSGPRTPRPRGALPAGSGAR